MFDSPNLRAWLISEFGIYAAGKMRNIFSMNFMFKAFNDFVENKADICCVSER